MIEREGYPLIFMIEQADLQYYYDKKNKCYVVEELESHQCGQGKKLVEAFIKAIGTGQLIKFQAIIEPETRRTLIKQGILQYVERVGKKMIFRNESLYKSLKITRMLLGGGANIEEMTIEPFSKNLNTNPEESETIGDLHRVTINVFVKT
jgi:translation elongation factor P/translation initiation factor 5A